MTCPTCTTSTWRSSSRTTIRSRPRSHDHRDQLEAKHILHIQRACSQDARRWQRPRSPSQRARPAGIDTVSGSRSSPAANKGDLRCPPAHRGIPQHEARRQPDELQFTKEKEGAKGEYSSTQKQLKVPPVTSYDMKELRPRHVVEHANTSSGTVRWIDTQAFPERSRRRLKVRSGPCCNVSSEQGTTRSVAYIRLIVSFSRTRGIDSVDQSEAGLFVHLPRRQPREGLQPLPAHRVVQPHSSESRLHEHGGGFSSDMSDRNRKKTSSRRETKSRIRKVLSIFRKPSIQFGSSGAII